LPTGAAAASDGRGALLAGGSAATEGLGATCCGTGGDDAAAGAFAMGTPIGTSAARDGAAGGALACGALCGSGRGAAGRGCGGWDVGICGAAGAVRAAIGGIAGGTGDEAVGVGRFAAPNGGTRVGVAFRGIAAGGAVGLDAMPDRGSAIAADPPEIGRAAARGDVVRLAASCGVAKSSVQLRVAVMGMMPPQTEHRARMPGPGTRDGSTRNTDWHSGHDTFMTRRPG
jgi:hypothetical protein